MLASSLITDRTICWGRSTVATRQRALAVVPRRCSAAGVATSSWEGNLDSIGDTYESFAKTYQRKGDAKTAKKYYKRAIKSYQKLNLQVRAEKIIGLMDELNMNSEDLASRVNVVNDDIKQAKEASD